MNRDTKEGELAYANKKLEHIKTQICESYCAFVDYKSNLAKQYQTWVNHIAYWKVRDNLLFIERNPDLVREWEDDL